MKKVFSLLLLICLALSVLSGCESNDANKGTELTLDNYNQYLDLSARCSGGSVSCSVDPATTNYDFNDVEITVKAKGEYTIYYKTLIGYNSDGWPHYDTTIPHSSEKYDETFVLKLNIGGNVINTEEARVYFEMPNGTTIHGGTCEYEVVSITGTVTRIE